MICLRRWKIALCVSGASVGSCVTILENIDQAVEVHFGFKRHVDQLTDGEVANPKNVVIEKAATLQTVLTMFEDVGSVTISGMNGPGTSGLDGHELTD
jgi:hypothetical protein